jgi:Leucine-rich repeat (LRR) protein
LLLSIDPHKRELARSAHWTPVVSNLCVAMHARALAASESAGAWSLWHVALLCAWLLSSVAAALVSSTTSCPLDAFPAQRAALDALFSSNGLEPQSACLCDDSRVRCDATGAVSALHLSGLRSPSLPDSLSALGSSLQILDVSECAFTALPSVMRSFAELHSLSVTNCRLTALSPWLSELQYLQLADFSFNQLSAHPPQLGQLRNLEHLNVAYNSIASLPASVGDLVALLTLQVSNNRLTALPPELGRVPQLSELHAASNLISALPPALGSLELLSVLDVSSNLLSSLPVELSSLESLLTLIASGNRLSAFPPELCTLPILKRLILSSNRLTSLPYAIGELVELEALDLYDNLLEYLPISIADLQHLGSSYFSSRGSTAALDISRNRLEFLPNALFELTDLDRLSVSHNRLTALSPNVGLLSLVTAVELDFNALTSLPEELGALTRLSSLRLGNNALTALPASLVNLTQLREFCVENNSLTSLPDMFEGMSFVLETLSVRGNALSVLPPSIASLERVETLDASHNLLRSPVTLPAAGLVEADLSFNSLSSLNFTTLPADLRRLNVSFNNLSTFEGVLPNSALSLLDLSHNPLRYDGVCDVITSLASLLDLQSITSLSLASTNLSSFGPVVCVSSQSLMSLDLSVNNFSDADSLSLKFIMVARPQAQVFLGGNAGLSFDASRLVFTDPAIVPPRYFSREQMLCTEVLESKTSVTLRIDPVQRHYVGCLCRAMGDVQTLWSPVDKACVAPSFDLESVDFSARIDEHSLLLSVRTGFFPALAAGEDVAAARTSGSWSLGSLRMLRCHTPAACNPTPLMVGPRFDFSCADGRDPASNLCSQCLPGYFAVGAECLRCARGSGVAVVLVSLLVAAAAFLVAWRAERDSGSAIVSSAFPISFFFLQLSEALEQTLPLSTASTASVVPSQLLGLLYLRPFALECISPSGADAVSALWLWFGIILAIPAACGVACLALGGLHDAAVRQRATGCARTLCALIYLPVTKAALACFNREQQVADVAAYVSAAPEIGWGGRKHREMLALGVVITLGFVVPVPCLSFLRARRAWLALQGDNGLENATRIDPAARTVRDWASLWWWKPLVIDARRLAVAALVALMPWRSEWLAVALFALLTALYSATLLVQPYATASDNKLEGTLLLVAAFLYSAQISANLGVTTPAHSLVLAVAMASLLAKVAVMLHLARTGAERLGCWVLAKANERAASEWRELLLQPQDRESSPS